MEHKTKNILVVIGIVCLVGVGFILNRPHPNTVPLTEASPIPPAFPPQNLGDNKFYKNLLLRFSIIFPKDLTVEEYSKGNTSTIVFEDVSEGKEFQVFVVPYTQKEITNDRFKMDEPSGVFTNPTDILIDGIHATMFFSTNAAIGDTREVWFINNGFLYEITTEKDLDLWLSDIMKSWKFL